MKILIIGGTGLISTETTRALLARGDDVTLFNRGKRHCPFEDRVTRIAGDRHERADFENRIRQAGPFDCVIDMIGFTPQDAESSILACTGITNQFIFCSTVDVYAKPASRYPYTESEPQVGLSDYARRKVECERLFQRAHAERAFGLTIIRPAHTYCDRGSIIHALDRNTSFLDRIRCGKPVVIHGDGASLWTAAHARDVGPAFAAAAGNPVTFGKSYHVAAEECVTWSVYYEKVAASLGAPLPDLVHIPAAAIFRLAGERGRRTFENFQYCNIFDNTAARTDLGYTYTTPLADGLKQIVRRLDDHDQILKWQDDPDYDAIIQAWKYDD